MSESRITNVFSWLSPKRHDDQYLGLLKQHVSNTEECAVELNALFANLADESGVERISDFEHRGDELAGRAHGIIDRMFIPKFGKSDMTALISELDNVIDRMNQAAKSVRRYRLTEAEPEAHRMTALILETVASVRSLVGELNKLDTGKIRQHVFAIKEKEEESDVVWNEAIGRLYESEPDVKRYLAWKEVFDRLEQVVDACQNVGDVIAAVAREQAG
jgi:hypothetical protein